MFSLCLTHSLHGVAFNAIDRYDIRRFTHLVGGEVRVFELTADAVGSMEYLT